MFLVSTIKKTIPSTNKSHCLLPKSINFSQLLQYYLPKRIFFFSWDCPCSFVKDQLTVALWVYTWGLYSVPLNICLFLHEYHAILITVAYSTSWNSFLSDIYYFYYYYYFHLHFFYYYLVLLYSPSPNNHHIVVHVHESFFQL